MGLGKTVQAIAACELLRRRGEASRVLVVTPASLKDQWAREIARYAGERAVTVGGGSDARRRAFETDAPYRIVNYELTWRELERIQALDADVLVLDEAQRAKNFRTKTATTLRKLPSRFLFVLTGTPIENRLDDLYSLMQLVDPAVLGPLWRFNHDFHVQRLEKKGRVSGTKNLGDLRARLAPVVMRRRKEEVLAQLPALVEQTRYTPLTDVQAKLEGEHRSEAARLMKIAEKRPLRPEEHKRLMAHLLKARQACDAAELCDPHRGKGSPKLDELELLVSEIVEQGTAKILVFSEWIEMLELAARRLEKLGVGFERLHGSIPTEKRPELLRRFRENADVRVLLSTDAGGVGLNLQEASYVVHLDLPWNPGKLDQRTARAHRLGQKSAVTVTYLCAETGIERGIEGTLGAKRALRGAALDAASEVDAVESVGFTVFLAQLREAMSAMSGAAAVAEETDVLQTTAEPIARIDVGEAARSVTTEAQQPSAPTVRHESAPRSRADDRLRLARVVLDAGFAADAVTAAYDALAAAIASVAGEDKTMEHAALVARMYRELVPHGKIPAALAGVLARLRDLTLLRAEGVDLDRAIAGEAVAEAETWVARLTGAHPHAAPPVPQVGSLSAALADAPS
jgi:superfamily II DNA or RNA helicase